MHDKVNVILAAFSRPTTVFAIAHIGSVECLSRRLFVKASYVRRARSFEYLDLRHKGDHLIR